MPSQTDWDNLAAAHADAFGMTVSIGRANVGGAFDPSSGTETGGSSLSATVRANRIRREIVDRVSSGGGIVKVEQTTYQITLADMQTPISGTWSGGDPRHGDTLMEGGTSPGDGMTRRVTRSHRLPTLPIIEVVAETALVRGS